MAHYVGLDMSQKAPVICVVDGKAGGFGTCCGLAESPQRGNHCPVAQGSAWSDVRQKAGLAAPGLN